MNGCNYKIHGLIIALLENELLNLVENHHGTNHDQSMSVFRIEAVEAHLLLAVMP